MPSSFDPIDCSSPGSSVHKILQARILEWVAISFSRGSSQPRDWTSSQQADYLASEPPGKPGRSTSPFLFSLHFLKCGFKLYLLLSWLQILALAELISWVVFLILHRIWFSSVISWNLLKFNRLKLSPNSLFGLLYWSETAKEALLPKVPLFSLCFHLHQQPIGLLPGMCHKEYFMPSQTWLLTNNE